MSNPAQDVTQLLIDWSDGNPEALEKLVPIVEGELRRLAQRYLRQEHSGHTLQTTALVNEAYVRLIDWKKVRWQNRAHFVGVSAQLMRRILVDYARNQHSLKRGGDVVKVPLEEAAVASMDKPPDLLALDEALTSLGHLDSRKCKIVELRYFGGLSVEETAELLEISPRTVKREWSLAQAWLYTQLVAPS
jgi:RNA polymerase sigma factor (TIGR02999 family)